MNYAIENVRDFVVECCECHFYYVEKHMTLREVSKEVLLHPSTVQRRLNALKEIDNEMYSEYVAERRKRKNGKK